jgi:ABC-type lipoprotein release transport system permease subunit
VLEDVRTMDAVVGDTLMCVARLASVMPAYRASRLAPSDVLRAD